MMSGIIIELAFALYFMGVGLPGLMSTPRTNSLVLQFAFGVGLLVLVLLGVDLSAL